MTFAVNALAKTVNALATLYAAQTHVLVVMALQTVETNGTSVVCVKVTTPAVRVVTAFPILGRSGTAVGNASSSSPSRTGLGIAV
jgi:hypothetical protein